MTPADEGWEKVMRLDADDPTSPCVLEIRALDEDGDQLEIEARSSVDKFRASMSWRFVTSRADLLQAIEELTCRVDVE